MVHGTPKKTPVPYPVKEETMLQVATTPCNLLHISNDIAAMLPICVLPLNVLCVIV